MRFKELFERAAPTPQLTNTPIAMFTVNVPAAKRGTDVADMQKALVALGYPLPRFGVDGIIGPETIGALKKFQLANQLPGNGIADKTTIAALNTALAANPQAAANLTPSTQADVKQRATPVKKSVGVAKPLAPLATDAVTQGKVGGLLNLIARYESGGNYNIVVGGKTVPELTKMTLAQVDDFQRRMLADGHESTAVGRYQYIQKTLRNTVKQMGLDPNTTTFNEKTQDAIATYTLRYRGLDKWLSGQMTDSDFLNSLAKEWASIPTTSGRSYYAGVGSNKAGTSANNALAALQQIQATA